MTARVLVTERLFWRHWPEVAKDFRVSPDEEWLRSQDGGECPITAVAKRLGAGSEERRNVIGVLRVKDGAGGSSVPGWACDVIEAADYGPDECAGRRVLSVYRRLVKYIPEVTP